MGTSLSTTKTLQRLQQQRHHRSQGKSTKKTHNQKNFIPLDKRETQRENEQSKKPQQQNTNNIASQNLQNFSIQLKTYQYINPVEAKNIDSKNNESNKMLSIKQSLKENISTNEKVLTVSKIEPKSQYHSKSSIQQITFHSKVLPNPVSIQSQNKVGSPVKPVVRLQTPVSEISKQKIVNFQPVSLNPQFSQFADKQMSEKERKRKEDAIKYIKDSQFLSGKKELSNNVYQIRNISPRKVEELLPSKNIAINLSSQMQERKQVFVGSRIKIKSEEEELELPPKDSQSIMSRRKDKNSNSVHTVGKRY